IDAAKLKAAAEKLNPGTESTGSQPSEAAAVKNELVTLLDSAVGQKTIQQLKGGELPTAGSPAPVDSKIKASLDAVENLNTDAEIASVMAGVDNQSLETALRSGRDQAQAFDAATKPLNQTVDRLENLLDRLTVQAQSNPGTDRLDILSRSLNR